MTFKCKLPVVVPDDFLGIIMLWYPESKIHSTSKEPPFPLGVARCHDYLPGAAPWPGTVGVLWGQIHTAANTFDWSYLDTWMAYQRSKGRTTIYSLEVCPAWAAANSTVDSRGFVGGNGPPANITNGIYTDLSSFVTALVTRYNTVSAFNLDGYKYIDGIEVFNEPQVYPTGAMTAVEIVSMMRTTYLAAKAVDPTITVYSPSFKAYWIYGGSNDIDQILNASDGFGGKGKDWIDGLSVHIYNRYHQQPYVVNTNLRDYLMFIRGIAVKVGLSWNVPLIITEMGFTHEPYSVATNTQRLTDISRNLLIAALFGVKHVMLYSYDEVVTPAWEGTWGTHVYLGDPLHNVELSEGLSKIASQLVGRTIFAVEQDEVGGMFRVKTDQGSFTC